ncbi:MAG: hypothetical protein E7317_09805, partial [Clostridiales bacterium]|nr:hypothetical protein [Clostridiales bacterium]
MKKLACLILSFLLLLAVTAVAEEGTDQRADEIARKREAESMIPSRKIAARELPPLMVMQDGEKVRTEEQWRARRAELIDMLAREEYGYTPQAPDEVTGTVESSAEAFAAKAVQETVTLSFDTPNGGFSFPFTLIVPHADGPAPVFVVIAFRPDVPDKYLPMEEIIDRGYAVATFCYKDVTSDSAEMDGIASMYPWDEKTGWGKIGMWAFAASRVMDYLETRPDIDASRACVTGHSRLGKTALWCGAQDERFGMVISNDSGCSGAALSRDKLGETVKAITDVFPYWFCGNYAAWADREEEMPFDQHMLLSLIAPRKLYVCSAEQDAWADPENEYLACCAASEAWQL